MKLAPSLLFALVSLPTVAQSQITYLAQTRTISAFANAPFSDLVNIASATESDSAPDLGPYDRTVTARVVSDVTGATATAAQRSILTTDRMVVTVSSDTRVLGTQVPGTGASTVADAIFDVRFSVQEWAALELEGMLEGRGSVEVIRLPVATVYSATGQGGSVALSTSVLLTAGDYALRASARANAFSQGAMGGSDVSNADFVADVRPLVETYCTSTAGASGTPARIDALNLPSLVFGVLSLEVTGAAPSELGFFFHGTMESATPFGAGTLCIGGSPARLLPPVATDPTGRAVGDVDLFPAGSAPPFAAGETHLFQFWFTEPPNTGAAFNTSDALRVMFVE